MEICLPKSILVQPPRTASVHTYKYYLTEHDMRQQKAVAESCRMQPSASACCAVQPQRVRASEGPLQLASKQVLANDPQFSKNCLRPASFAQSPWLSLRRPLQDIPPHISDDILSQQPCRPDR